MERNLFKYVWHHTRRDQVWILFMVLISMPIYFLSLDLPKQIVNGPIEGQGFDSPGAVTRVLRIAVDLPDFLAREPVLLFSGFEIERLPYLIMLSLIFLALVCVNGLFKFYINTYKGRLGERMLRRLRYELLDRVLRFPYPHFRRVKTPEVASMIKDEIEPLGGFIGNAFVQPVFLGGQALTAMAFIIIQDFWLGSIAGGIVLVQAYIIPKLRRRLLVLAKERQLTARELAGRVGEIVDGIAEVHTNDTSNYERADMAHRLGRIFFIRYEFYQRKFFVKFLNNFLAQTTPFFFYLIGGYFAVRGSLDIDQLVAVIAAYKDLPSPIKELIDWDQQRLDTQIKYTQVVDQFTPSGLMDGALQEPVASPDGGARTIDVRGLGVIDETGAKLVEDVSFTVPGGARIATVGEVNSGAETVSEVLARLIVATSGRVHLGGQNFEDLPEAVVGRRFGYVGSDIYLANRPLSEGLLYGLKHVPRETPESSSAKPAKWRAAQSEARLSGNTTLDIAAEWLDLEAAGVDNRADLERRVLDILRLVELDQDVFRFGLRGRIDPTVHEGIAERVLAARAALREKLAEPAFRGLVEPFDPDTYNTQATVGGNLLFGTAVDERFKPENLPRNDDVLELLKQADIDAVLVEMGRQIASTVVELFADLPPDHPFFEELTFMEADEIPLYQTLINENEGRDFADLAPKCVAMMLRLSFAYIEPRHRLGLLDDELRQRILEARRAIRERLLGAGGGAVSFYDPERYNEAASLQDNILFGRISYGIADAAKRMRAAIGDVLDQLEMRDVVYETGLGFIVGTGGKRLTTVQRQKVSLARALLKRPDLLIVNRGLAGLSGQAQGRIIERVLAMAAGDGGERPFAVFWVLANAGLAKPFDHVLVFEDGRIVQSGKPDELSDQGRMAVLLEQVG